MPDSPAALWSQAKGLVVRLILVVLVLPCSQLTSIFAITQGKRVVADTNAAVYVGQLASLAPASSQGRDSITIVQVELPSSPAAGRCPPASSSRSLDEHVIPLAQVKSLRAHDSSSSPLLPGGVSSAAHSPHKLRTDRQISARDRLSSRPLQKWSAGGDWADEDEDGLPELDLAHGHAAVSGWDQFATNEAKTGVKSDYHEDIYTVALDRSAHDFDQRAERAQRLADEILSDPTANAHRLEERGEALHKNEGAGNTEEEKYGAVQRDSKLPLASPPTTPPPVVSMDHEAALAHSKEVPESPTAPPITTVTPPALSDKSPSGKEKEKTKRLSAVCQAVRTRAQGAKDEAALAADTSGGSEAGKMPHAPTAVGPGPTGPPLTKYQLTFDKFVVSEQTRISHVGREKHRIDKSNQLAALREFAASLHLKTPCPEDISVWTTKKRSVSPRVKESGKSDGTAPPVPTTERAQAGKSSLSAPLEAAAGEVHSSTLDATSISTSGQPASLSTARSSLPRAPVPPKPVGKFDLSKMTLSAIPPFNSERTQERAASATAARLSSQASNFHPGGSSASKFKGKDKDRKLSSSAGKVNPFFGHKVPNVKESADVLLNFSCLRQRDRVAPQSVSHLWLYHGRSFRTIFMPPSTPLPPGTPLPFGGGSPRAGQGAGPGARKSPSELSSGHAGSRGSAVSTPAQGPPVGVPYIVGSNMYAGPGGGPSPVPRAGTAQPVPPPQAVVPQVAHAVPQMSPVPQVQQVPQGMMYITPGYGWQPPPQQMQQVYTFPPGMGASLSVPQVMGVPPGFVPGLHPPAGFVPYSYGMIVPAPTMMHGAGPVGAPHPGPAPGPGLGAAHVPRPQPAGPGQMPHNGAQRHYKSGPRRGRQGQGQSQGQGQGQHPSPHPARPSQGPAPAGAGASAGEKEKA